MTTACLDSLVTTIDNRDQVVVVDNGSSDETSQGLLRYPWVEVLHNEENRGFAPGCNQGAAVARGEVVVFLNNDTLVSPGWLEELLEPFTNDEVAAVGPRSNGVSGAQWVDAVTYDERDGDSRDEFARRWRRAHRGETSESARLVGFCLAVRAEDFRRVDGFDEGYLVGGYEDDDLGMKLRQLGRRLIIAHGSYVHHAAHATFDANRVDWVSHQNENQRRFERKWGSAHVTPLCLLSACLIVKDEEELLATCLQSISDLVDEIVVYDTGSTDRTVEIARAAGARVIEGFWDNSFARARNAALAEARGEWVLSIDADETLLYDARSLRDQLADRRKSIEAYLVSIENLHGVGRARSVHTAVRLFRRTAATWRHRIHEQVVEAEESHGPLRVGYLSGARIIHRGYTAEMFESRNKVQRNLELAEASLEDPGLSRGYTLMNYGRALETAERYDDAVAALDEARRVSEDPTTKRVAVMSLINIHGRLGRFDEALAEIVELRSLSASQIAADIAEGRIRIAMGDPEFGLALLARVPAGGRDDNGMEYGAHLLASMRADALATLGRDGEAADVVLEAITLAGVHEADVGELVGHLTRAQRPLETIAEVLEPEDLLSVLGRMLRRSPIEADAVCEGAWHKFPERLEPLAAAARLGPRLNVARALVWSSRLRGAGLASACPLRAMAKDESLEPRLRVLAGAAAFGSFADYGVVGAVRDARERMDAETLVASSEETRRLAPGLLEAAQVEVAHVEVVAPLVAPTATTSNPPFRPAVTTRHVHRTTAVVAATSSDGGINIVGPFDATSVEGTMARLIAGAMRHQGLAVSTTTYSSESAPGPVTWQHPDAGDYPFETTLFVLSPEELGNYVVDQGPAAFEGRYGIGVWAWDYDEPPAIMSTTGALVHEFWTPSEYSSAALSKGTDKTVLTVRLPLGRDVIGAPASHQGATTFLASVDYTRGFARQNPLGVLDAYRRAVAEDEGHELVIETRHARRYPLEHRLLLDAAKGRRDVLLVEGERSLFDLVDVGEDRRACLVSLHRCEGTGLALAHALAKGVPVIASAHSFATETMGERDGFLVPCRVEELVDDGRSGLRGTWADVSLDDAASAMRRVVDDRSLSNARAKRGATRARRQFSPALNVRLMAERVTHVERARRANEPVRVYTPLSSTH